MIFFTSPHRPRPPAVGPASRPVRPPSPRPRRPEWLAPAAFGVAAVALGVAVQVNYGQYHPVALCWLTVALLAAAAGCRWMCRTEGSESGPAAAACRHYPLVPSPPSQADYVLLAGLALQFAMLLSRQPGAAELSPAADLRPFRTGLAVAAACALAAVIGPRRVRPWAVGGMLATHLAVGAWVLRALPTPTVDVVVFQRDACAAMMRGINPYGITFPDVSPPGSDLYGPGLAVGGRARFGYPYPPAALLLALPGHLAGDFRWAQLVAMTLAGGLVAWTYPGRRAAAAGLLLFTPRGFFVLQAGWTEPFVVLGLAAVVFAAGRPGRRHVAAVDRRAAGDERSVRSGVGLAVVLGLFLATKQYIVLALPAAALLWPGRSRADRVRMVLAALLTAAALTVPLALWDVKAFAHSVILLQLRQPFRPDALSYLVPLSGVVPPPYLAAVPFVLAPAAAWWASRRLPRTPAGFAAAVAVTFLVFFAFNKQAFCNYYHFAIAALCCAAGGRGSGGVVEWRSDGVEDTSAATCLQLHHSVTPPPRHSASMPSGR